MACDTSLDDDVESVAGLFTNLGTLWAKATFDERSKLIAPLLDMAYIDIETRKIEAIIPAPAFRTLLEQAMEQVPEAKCTILSMKEALESGRGSVWWRRGRLELPVRRDRARQVAANTAATWNCSGAGRGLRPRFRLERRMGLEPMTFCLGSRCSAS